MIILKILLYILLAVFGIILLVMIMPVGADISYLDGKFSYKVKLWIFDIMDSDGGGLIGWLKKRKSRPKKPKKEKNPKPVKDRKSKKKKSVVNDDDFLADFDFDEPVSEEITAAENVSVSEIKTEIQSEEKSAEYEKTAESAPELSDTDYEILSDEQENEESDGKKKKKKPKKEKEKKTLSDWIELGTGIWESAQRPMLKIFKAFHFSDFYVDFIIADEDAYKCALNYGRISGGVYNIIAFMSLLFTVRLKTVDVNCAFGQNKSRWDFSCRIFFRVGNMVLAGLWFVAAFVFRVFIPDKIRAFKRRKFAERQK